MPNYSTNLKVWGDTGEEFPSGYSYEEGEQPVDDWDNFFNYEAHQDIDHLINVTNSPITISGNTVELGESIDPGVTDFAVGTLSDGDVLVNSGGTLAGDSSWVEQSSLDAHESSTTGVHGVGASTIASQDWVNNNADVPSADNADTVDGSDAEELAPQGIIVMWSGSSTNVPTGWTLCDGTDGAPNLQNRFVVGAGGSYTSGDTGGSSQVTLSESEMPSHSHSGTTSTDGNHSHTEQYQEGGSEADTTQAGTTTLGGLTDDQTSTDGSHNHSFTTSTEGGDAAHENRPPYYALAYIMKT